MKGPPGERVLLSDVTKPLFACIFTNFLNIVKKVGISGYCGRIIPVAIKSLDIQEK